MGGMEGLWARDHARAIDAATCCGRRMPALCQRFVRRTLQKPVLQPCSQCHSASPRRSIRVDGVDYCTEFTEGVSETVRLRCTSEGCQGFEPKPTQDNSCGWSNDGTCDGTLVCDEGTDCSDCGTCPELDAPELDAECVCDDSCEWSNDGSCEDGGPGKQMSICDLGTDCADCGPSTRDTDGGKIPGITCGTPLQRPQ